VINAISVPDSGDVPSLANAFTQNTLTKNGWTG